ncbi:membrane protein, MarC family [Acetobacteraceae bacterium AT-5844]|nr:membrane protein, MarC family [Acetobacteraceae bacterium AT-5844]
MLDDYTLFVTQLVTLWAVLDPIGHLPLFMGATGGLDGSQRRRAAVIGILVSFGILVLFGLAGQALLHAMGVSLLSFQIAGGIILFLFAVSMVLGDHHKPQAAAAGDNVLALAIHPIAMPIIAGPGAMLSMVLLLDNNRHSPWEQGVTVLALIVVLSALLGTFLLGGIIQRLIGEGGTNVLRRVMGLILSALAVNMVLNALALWLKLPEI